MNNKNDFPQHRIQSTLAVAPQTFSLAEFARLYRTRFGHSDASPKFNNYSWKLLASRIDAAGCKRVSNENPVRPETTFAQTPAAASFSPSPPAPVSEPARPASTIERMEAKLLELQRMLELQQKIKEVEAQIELF